MREEEEKAARPGFSGQAPGPSAFAAPKPPRPEATMHSDAQTRKAGGRLSREDQRRLGDILQRVYDDVVRQGVPDRFKDLLGELDGPQHGLGNAGTAPSTRGPDAEESREPDRLVG